MKEWWSCDKEGRKCVCVVCVKKSKKVKKSGKDFLGRKDFFRFFPLCVRLPTTPFSEFNNNSLLLTCWSWRNYYFSSTHSISANQKWDLDNFLNPNHQKRVLKSTAVVDQALKSSWSLESTKSRTEEEKSIFSPPPVKYLLLTSNSSWFDYNCFVLAFTQFNVLRRLFYIY